MVHLADYFGRAVCQLAVEIGQAFASVATALIDAFGVAASTIESWLSGVAQAFASWVDAIEKYLDQPLDFACYVEIDNTKGRGSRGTRLPSPSVTAPRGCPRRRSASG